MKRFVTTVFLTCCASILVFAQVVVTVGSSISMAAQKPPIIIDTTVMQVVYKVYSVADSLAPDKVATDDMVLQIGKNRISKFYNDTRRAQDSLIRATMEKQRAAAEGTGGSISLQNVNFQAGAGGSGEQSIVFKNRPSGKITITDKVVIDNYSFTESSNQIKWEILPDTDTILSYAVQKAVTTFRGRSYEAWFTPDIPVNEGPWKFCGLPGLILKVSDSRQHYVFECVGLEQVRTPIEFADSDYVKTNRKDLARIKRKFYEDPMAAMERMRPAAPAGANVKTVRMAIGPDGMPVQVDENEMRSRLRNRAYNPIELDL